MTTTINEYRPDYALPPGRILESRLKAQEMSQAEFARRCGRSPKLISEIISGKAPLGSDTALQFERVLGVAAEIWVGIERDYQLHRARQDQVEAATIATEWVREFPLGELIKLGCIQKSDSRIDDLSKILAFFGVGSVDAWNLKYGSANVAYRRSKTVISDEKALATWRRLGELITDKQECAAYNEEVFRQSVQKIRGLTRMPIKEAMAHTIELCNQAGVVFDVAQPLPKTALSGAAWWLNPRKAIILLSARHKSDDHLWFSFFHEAAHVILHSKKTIFMDSERDSDCDLETEANRWAKNALVPKREWKNFITGFSGKVEDVQAFAKEQEIAPGIIVGMLQHEKILAWNRFNSLKAKYKWDS